MLPACSSISLPSLPWSGSALKTDPTAEALFEEGTRNFNDKKYVRAIDSFTKIKTDHPFSPLVTQAELMVADAHYLNEQFPEAINLFKEFQSLHPTSEHLPFVTLRLGQSYFDQFTAIDREQKNTELAKGYFEAVITNYPKSPQAAIAKTKLAQAIEYLAEHEFSAADFYFKQQKFPPRATVSRKSCASTETRRRRSRACTTWVKAIARRKMAHARRWPMKR